MNDYYWPPKPKFVTAEWERKYGDCKCDDHAAQHSNKIKQHSRKSLQLLESIAELIQKDPQLEQALKKVDPCKPQCNANGLSTALKQRLFKHVGEQALPAMREEMVWEGGNAKMSPDFDETDCKYKLNSAQRDFFSKFGIWFWNEIRNGNGQVTYDGNSKIKGNSGPFSIQKKSWSLQGTAFAFTLAAFESGYGNTQSVSKALDNHNYWGLGGARSFMAFPDNEVALAYWLNNLSIKWPSAVSLLEQGNFTSDEMNRALNSGIYVELGESYNYDIARYDTLIANSIDGNSAPNNEIRVVPVFLDYAGFIQSPALMTKVLDRFKCYLIEDIENLKSKVKHLQEQVPSFFKGYYPTPNIIDYEIENMNEMINSQMDIVSQLNLLLK